MHSLLHHLAIRLQGRHDGGPAPSEVRSPQWPTVRKHHLEREPVCAVCGGSARLNVHHVRPYHLFPELELEAANLITLCEAPGLDHHLLFGHLLSWKAWNPRVRDDAADWKAKIALRRVA